MLMPMQTHDRQFMIAQDSLVDKPNEPKTCILLVILVDFFFQNLSFQNFCSLWRNDGGWMSRGHSPIKAAFSPVRAYVRSETSSTFLSDACAVRLFTSLTWVTMT